MEENNQNQQPPVFDQPVVRESGANEPTSDERTMSVLAHILGLVTGFIVPLILYLIKGSESKTIRHHSVEALNFQISIMIYGIASGILMFVIIGMLLLPVIGLLDIILCIVAAIKASNNELYRYPLTIRFIK